MKIIIDFNKTIIIYNYLKMFQLKMEQTNFCKKLNLIKKLVEKTFKNKNDNDNNNIYIYHSKKNYLINMK